MSPLSLDELSEIPFTDRTLPSHPRESLIKSARFLECSTRIFAQVPSKMSRLILLLLVAAPLISSLETASLDKSPRSVLSGQGIVVPKRSNLISNIDHQFRHRVQLKQHQDNKTQPANHSTAIVQPQGFITGHFPHLFRPNHQLKPKRGYPTEQSSSLLVDRQQQELLAANPNLSISDPLLVQQTRASLQYPPTTLSNVSSLSAHHKQDLAASSFAVLQQSSAFDVTDQPRLYRGYSLIELEIKNELDRRYVQDLYANLSAMVNEQAANSHASPQVSPYVDVDFWSFGRLNAVNDQIDIMVSPRSRPILLGMVSRARIKHRIKIEDIQARIDRDQMQFDGPQLQIPIQPASGSAFEPGQVASAKAQTPAVGLPRSIGSNGRLSGDSIKLSLDKTIPSNLNLFNQRETSLHGRQANDVISSTNGNTNGNLINSSPFASKGFNDSVFFENYQRLGTINQYLELIVQRNSDIAQVKVIGRSSQGRHLRVLKLGYEQMVNDEAWTKGETSRDASPSQPQNASQILSNFLRRQRAAQKVGSIWLDGGTHAREWISPATVLYLAFRFSDNHDKCSKFFKSLESIVSQHENSIALSGNQQGEKKQQSNRVDQNDLDMNLLNGINEINVQLLNPKSTLGYRPRTELEKMLELLGKSPQVLASEYGCDLEVDQILRRYTFFIMPVLNPDGYEYSHTHNRLWRKTRSTSSHPIYRHFCLGVDPNRNYDAQHGSTGSSTHPCSQTYAGATPFTEPETRHQSNFVYANRFGMKMYISFHSYSQMILLPLSHSKQTIPDLKDLESVGTAAVKAIEQTHGTVYRIGPSASILYTASGTASDWAYEKANVKYSYTIELRDTGSHGFLLPRQQIIPTGEETFNGLLAMIGQMEKNSGTLTSKSTPVISSPNDKNSQLSDYNRVSQADLDQLNNFNNHRNRPQLESVRSVPSIDGNRSELAPTGAEPDASGSHSATAESTLMGVRDRKTTSKPQIEESLNDPNGPQYNPQDYRQVPPPGDARSEALLNDRLDPLGQPLESVSEDNDPDSSFALEGEGELMEPAIELDDAGFRAHVTESKLTSRRIDSSRRIFDKSRRAPNGRNSINSPVEREDTSAAKRESSGNLLTVSKTSKSRKQIR